MVRHSFQHFEGHIFGCTIFLSQQIGVGDGEQVVGSYSKMQYPCVFGHQCPFQQMQVVGVYFFFGRADRIGPASQRRDDGFHFQVAAFHQTHLDRGTAFCYACFGKFDQFGLKVVCVRQICLNDDSGGIILELRQAEHCLEEA